MSSASFAAEFNVNWRNVQMDCEANPERPKFGTQSDANRFIEVYSQKFAWRLPNLKNLLKF